MRGLLSDIFHAKSRKAARQLAAEYAEEVTTLFDDLRYLPSALTNHQCRAKYKRLEKLLESTFIQKRIGKEFGTDSPEAN